MIADIRTVFVRELKPTLHDPGMMTISMVQPLVFLALFGPLAIGAGTATLQWFLPGILVMSALYGASMAGSSLLFEIQTGAHERLLVTPLKRPALLIGRALKEVVPMAFQAALLVLVTLPFGFDPSLAGIVLGLAILAVFAIGLGALSHTLALVVGKNDWVFWTIQQTVLFPVLILSGMLLATDTRPGLAARTRGGRPAQVHRRRRAGAVLGRSDAGRALRRAGRARDGGRRAGRGDADDAVGVSARSRRGSIGCHDRQPPPSRPRVHRPGRPRAAAAAARQRPRHVVIRSAPRRPRGSAGAPRTRRARRRTRAGGRRSPRLPRRLERWTWNCSQA